MNLGNKLIFPLICLVCFYLNSKAQDTTINNTYEQFIENISEQNNSEDVDLSNLLTELSHLKKKPINLNNTTTEELLSLQLINEIQAKNILSHIKTNGSFISVYELQSVEGLSLKNIYDILPYITIEEKYTLSDLSFKQQLKEGQQRLITRGTRVIEPQRGYDKNNNTHYLGSPYKLYTRYRYFYSKKMSMGITAEKDAGEEFFKGTQLKGFDFYSAHFYYEPDRIIKKIVLGDYLLNFGQGLNMWQGFAFSKTIDVVSVKRIASGIKPYLSTDENRFHRGAAVTAQHRKIELTGFASIKPIDANINIHDSTSNTSMASSLQESGLHSTLNEMADKHSIKQNTYGGNIHYKGSNLGTGLTYSHVQLSKTIQAQTQPYNTFYFSGNSINNISADYSYSLKNFIFFGEGAISYKQLPEKDYGYAYINGLMAAIDPKVSVSILQRNYSRNYHSFFSNAFGENSRNNNEQGLYAGIQIKFSEKLILNSYYDKYKFPWLKYGVSKPSTGNDLLIQIDYTPSKKTNFYLRYKNENNFQNSYTENQLIEINRQNIRIHLNHKTGKHILLKSRIEFIEYKNRNGQTELGNIISQDIILSHKKINVYARYALFDTPSYESRIYSYENDLPGVWSSPAYYYKGSRMYAMIKIKTGKHLHCWLRYSQTFYSDRNIISEGSLNEINGNKKSEIKAQIDYNF